MRTSLRRKNERYPDTFTNWQAAAGVIATACAAVEGGLRPDRKRLADDERPELIRLTLTGTEGGGFSLARLDKKEVGRWETLVEKATGKQPGSVFERARDLAHLEREMRKLAVAARKPPRKPKFEEEGAVVLPRGIFEWLRDGVIWLDDVAVLCFLLSIWESGETTSTITFDGQTLVVDTRKGLGVLDPAEQFLSWKKTLESLDRVALVSLEKRGALWRVERGTALLQMLRERG